MIEGHYLGQTWETVAKAPLGAFDEDRRAELESEFHETHERLWAFRADDLPIVVLNRSCVASGNNGEARAS